MTYPFPPDLERLVRDHMSQGGYTSEDEVLRDALRALGEINLFRPTASEGQITSFEALQREVSRGMEQLDRGEGKDAEDVFDELLRDLPSANQD